MAKVPAFADYARSAKDLLYGPKDGGFQFNKVLTVASRTSDGVDFAIKTVIKAEGGVENELKSVLSRDKATFTGTLTQAGKLSLSAVYKELAPGLAAGLSGVAGDPESAKLAVDYVVPHLTAKAAFTVTAAPKVDVSASTGHQGLVAGGEASYDTAKSAVTKWAVGVGYQASDYSASVALTDAQLVTAAYAHRVNADVTVGAEASRKLSDAGAVTFAAGLSKRLDSGALAKARVDHKGLVAVLYEQELSKTKLAVSGQFDSLNLSAAPKLGFGYHIKY